MPSDQRFFFTFQPQSIEYNHRYVQNRHFSIPPSVYSHPRKKLSLSVCSSVRSFICYKTCERDIFKTNCKLNRFWCQLVHGASSCNKCIGDDTKAAAGQSPNCIKKLKKYDEKRFSIWGMEFLHPAITNVSRNCLVFKDLIVCLAFLIDLRLPTADTIVHNARFLSRVSILTGDIDIANLSVCPSPSVYPLRSGII